MGETNWRHFDFWLLGVVAILTIFGITMIRSAIAGNIELEDANIVQRQLIFAIGGFVVVFITASIDYHLWASISRPMYIITAVFLAALTIAGQALYGSARWFDTGLILIQPSELVPEIAGGETIETIKPRARNQSENSRAYSACQEEAL